LVINYLRFHMVFFFRQLIWPVSPFKSYSVCLSIGCLIINMSHKTPARKFEWITDKNSADIGSLTKNITRIFFTNGEACHCISWYVNRQMSVFSKVKVSSLNILEFLEFCLCAPGEMLNIVVSVFYVFCLEFASY